MIPREIHRYSENTVLVSLQTENLLQAIAALRSLQAYVESTLPKLISDIIPAYQSILIILNSVDFYDSLIDLIDEFLSDVPLNITENLVEETEIPICFDSALGNDLEEICRFGSIESKQGIELFLKRSYHVFMIGFLPGFPYMGEVDKTIAIPRKKAPVPTKSGAVGIAGFQTGIYPINSPGGWHIIGYTPYSIFDLNRPSPSLLKRGDVVKYVPIDLETFYNMKNEISGSLVSRQ